MCGRSSICATRTSAGAPTARRGCPVAPDDIAADYALSGDRLRGRYAARGEENQNLVIDAFFAERGTTAGELIVATLAELDVDASLRGAGLTGAELATLRRRLVRGATA